MNAKRKHYFGIIVDKVTDSFVIGGTITYDRYLKELYIFMLLGFWHICIGWLSKQRD